MKKEKMKKKENGDNMDELQWNVLRVSRSTPEHPWVLKTRDWFRKERVWNCENAGRGFKQIFVKCHKSYK